MTLSKQLLEVLACPKCKGEVRYEEEHQELVCDVCLLAFPVRDQIPVMLVDEARKI